MSLELEISFMVEYAIRDGKEMANVKLRDFKSNQEEWNKRSSVKSHLHTKYAFVSFC